MELFDLTGRTAIITGGNGGLGLAMARGLAKAGANIAIWARNTEKNAAARAELRALGKGQVIALPCDVADESTIASAMTETLAALGRVDICFANAGISGAGTAIPDITAEGWDHTQAINTRGAALVYKHVSRHMIARAKDGDAGGKLIATSSGQSIMGVNRSSDYAASKAALNGLTRAAAFELARHQITAMRCYSATTKPRLPQRLIRALASGWPSASHCAAPAIMPGWKGLRCSLPPPTPILLPGNACLSMAG